MEEKELINIINNQMDLSLPAQLSFDEMRMRLQEAVAHILETDFQRLVNILYRIDVNERKLKYFLQENVGEEAPVIIADLIIERQIEKIKSRRGYTGPDEDISDEEKW